jgi:3-hydroxyisobutyrate dehydrogenase-like beta-hydroxyacid dehydrogenase
MTPDANPLGLIGLGLMGSALAERLQAGSYETVGFDISPTHQAAVTDQAATAGEVLARCEITILSLPSHREVRAVLAGNAALWRAGQIVVDTTTGDPAVGVELAGELAARGVAYLDATISGSSAQVRTGDVVWMVGGVRAAFERCAKILGCVGRETIHTGAAGSGAKMKLVTNLVLGLNRAALAEGLALAGALELEPAQTLAVLRSSAAYSRIMDTKGEKMISGDFTPVARLSQHLKDVRLMLAAGADAGLKLPLSETHRALLETAEARGLGALDNSALIRVFTEA